MHKHVIYRITAQYFGVSKVDARLCQHVYMFFEIIIVSFSVETIFYVPFETLTITCQDSPIYSRNLFT